ncbi:MAG: ABC transporter permease [Actinobacteria bacterium]|nr:ABC transporter permease [Actinomycetota bacterium]
MRLTRAGFLRYATYRQAVFAGLVTNTVFGFLRTAIVLTVFTGSARVAGYDPVSAVAFVWVGQGLLAVVLIFGEGELAGRVRTGQVSVDLLRPVDLQAALLAEDVGRAGFAMLTRFAVPVVIGGFAFELALPTSPLRWSFRAVLPWLGGWCWRGRCTGWWCKVAERLEVYRRLLGGAVRSQLAYPASFGLQLAGQGLAQGADLLAILVLFGRVAAMGGFSRDEVLLIYGLASVDFGISAGARPAALACGGGWAAPAIGVLAVADNGRRADRGGSEPSGGA